MQFVSATTAIPSTAWQLKPLNVCCWVFSPRLPNKVVGHNEHFMRSSLLILVWYHRSLFPHREMLPCRQHSSFSSAVCLWMHNGNLEYGDCCLCCLMCSLCFIFCPVPYGEERNSSQFCLLRQCYQWKELFCRLKRHLLMLPL